MHLTDFPPHDPARWASIDGFSDDSITNGQRAAEAATYGQAHPQEESDFADLICNLFHLAHSLSLDLDQIQHMTLRDFHQEAGPLPAES